MLVSHTVTSHNYFWHLDISSSYIPMMTDFSYDWQPYLCTAHWSFNVLVLSDAPVFIWKATDWGELLSLAVILIKGTGNCLIGLWHRQPSKATSGHPLIVLNRCSFTLPNIFISVLTQKTSLSSRWMQRPREPWQSPCWSPQVFRISHLHLSVVCLWFDLCRVLAERLM